MVQPTHTFDIHVAWPFLGSAGILFFPFSMFLTLLVKPRKFFSWSQRDKRVQQRGPLLLFFYSLRGGEVQVVTANWLFH